MEKRSDIGILKTIGLTPARVRRIFIYNGLTIASVGVVAGWALALSVAWVQNTYQIVSLPPDIYFISYLPIETRWFDFLSAGVVAGFICFLAALYPATRAARLLVVDIVRQ